MYEWELEIAFEAELDTSENPELLAIAREQCNEDPATRATAITELRKMIFDRNECRPHRTDDAYLLRYLRARNFIVPRAHKLLVRYCKFRKQYPHLFEGVDLWSLVKLNDAYEGLMFDRPDVGRVSILRFGCWDPNEFTVEELISAGMATMEIGLRQPKMQVLGGTIIVDLFNLSLRHASAITPTVAHQIVSLLGLSIPVRVKSCHVINYSWVFNTFLYIFKRFIPQQTWEKIYFHGNDLKSLHQHVDPACLPARYGGTCRDPIPLGVWLPKIKKYRDEHFDREMKELGYIIKE